MMMNTPTPNAPSGEPKATKRSILGLLFNPQLGPAFSPLIESTRMFLQLLAGVFSVYGLLPKDYPGLNDTTTPISLRHIIASAWQNVRLTREGAPRAILFFAVVGIMAFGAVAAVLTLLSLFVSHAHAQTSSSSMFTSASGDLAQGWLDYLFVNASSSGSYASATGLEDPFSGSVSLQKALMGALALYSEAILIVAALILFYHLTVMVVETAHSGVPMGKTGRQIWAPIRLVVAIGLLVPINGGLNSGQYIAIKIAEMGSALASNVWTGFLTQLANYSSASLPPDSYPPLVHDIAVDMIRMKACVNAWNAHVAIASSTLPGYAGVKITQKTISGYVLGDTVGTKYTYTSNGTDNVDVCGWYFIPSGANIGGVPTGTLTNTSLIQQAANLQETALSGADAKFTLAAQDICQFIELPSGSSVACGTGTTTTYGTVSFNTLLMDAIAGYQSKLQAAAAGLSANNKSIVSAAIAQIAPYGWVMGGAFLNAIDRVQGDIASAIRDTMPITVPPSFPDEETAAMSNSYFSTAMLTERALQHYGVYEAKSMATQSSSANAACAAMVGLGAGSGTHASSNAMDKVFRVIDTVAQGLGVWSAGNGGNCALPSGSSASSGFAAVTSFKLGIQINGRDPFAQLAALGYNNLNTAFQLAGMGLAVDVAAAASKGFSGALDKNAFTSKLQKQANSVAGLSAIVGALGDMGEAAGSLLMFAAFAFFACGFTLAFLVPLMPFMRFFFAVLSWVGAIIEAVVAIPLVALAHLNPDGEGVAGQAVKAYYFLFNLFLRPVLCIFGLVCGLVLFLIAVSFLNYGYAIAVSSVGASTYGLATMGKMVYSILYIVLVYITANHAFMLIDHLPRQALGWMGQSGQAMPEMGNASQIEQYGALIAGYLGKDGMAAGATAAKKLGGTVGNIAGSGGKALGSITTGSGDALASKFGTKAVVGAGVLGAAAIGGTMWGGKALMAAERPDNNSGESPENLAKIASGAQASGMSPVEYMQNRELMAKQNLEPVHRPDDIAARAKDIENMTAKKENRDTGAAKHIPHIME